MNLFHLRKYLTEAEGKASDDCAAMGGTWRTIQGTHICVGKTGKGKRKRIILGPDTLKKDADKAISGPREKEPELGARKDAKGRWRDTKGKYAKAKKDVDEILGDHPKAKGFGAKKGKDGEPRFGKDGIPVTVPLFDTDVLSNMLDWASEVGELAANAVGAMSDKMFQAASDLYDVLDDFSQRGQS